MIQYFGNRQLLILILSKKSVLIWLKRRRIRHPVFADILKPFLVLRGGFFSANVHLIGDCYSILS
uniref:Uncharacterized protein n=1 Tax=Sphingobacterium sp. (strain 21) TaxID=743722 RepID=F4C2P4_SPHS2